MEGREKSEDRRGGAVFTVVTNTVGGLAFTHLMPGVGDVGYDKRDEQ